MNVSSQEVERVLQQHEGVLRAAVVGVPDDYWSEEVTAFVIAKPGSQLEPEALEQFCRDRMAVFKVPEDRRGGRGVPHRPAGQGPQARAAPQRRAVGLTRAPPRRPGGVPDASAQEGPG